MHWKVIARSLACLLCLWAQLGAVEAKVTTLKGIVTRASTTGTYEIDGYYFTDRTPSQSWNCASHAVCEIRAKVVGGQIVQIYSATSGDVAKMTIRGSVNLVKEAGDIAGYDFDINTPGAGRLAWYCPSGSACEIEAKVHENKLVKIYSSRKKEWQTILGLVSLDERVAGPHYTSGTVETSLKTYKFDEMTVGGDLIAQCRPKPQCEISAYVEQDRLIVVQSIKPLP